MKKLATIAVALIVSSTLYARVCKEDGDQAQMNQCAYEEFLKADKELNRVYRQLRAKKKDDKFFLKKLTIAQRAWIQFRDAELESIFPCKNEQKQMCYGSMYELLFYGTKAQMTKQRLKELRERIKTPTGF